MKVSAPILRATGANPRPAIYNASAAKKYSATNSVARFENKKLFFAGVKTL
jgi:hypothetical protein